MKFLHYFPTFDPVTTDLKQHARNIQLIAAWFKHSPLAQNLKLSHAQEWIAKAYGYNSYAGFKAQPKELCEFSVVHNLVSMIPQQNAADTLFLSTVQSYLVEDREELESIICFIEPTPLLLMVIERLISPKEDDLFLNLVISNYLGMHITRNGNQLTYEDTLLTERTLFLNETFMFFLDDEDEESVHGVLTIKSDSFDLCLFHINRPIHIAPPEIDLKGLAKQLGVNEVISLTFQSRLMDNIDVFTRHQTKFKGLWEDEDDEESSYELSLDESWGLQLEETGLRINHFEKLDEFKANDDLDLGVASIEDRCSFKLEYIDQSGQHQQCHVDNAELYFDLYRAKKSFRFYPVQYEIDAEIQQGLMADTLNYMGNTIVHLLEKHQYVLSCVWMNSDADFEHDMNLKLELKNKLIKIEAEVDAQIETIHREIIMNLDKYFDHKLLYEFASQVWKYNEVIQPVERQKAIERVIHDQRFKTRFEEVLEERVTALRESLYRKANINLSADQVNLKYIRQYIH